MCSGPVLRVLPMLAITKFRGVTGKGDLWKPS
jgi:hypothetical protein